MKLCSEMHGPVQVIQVLESRIDAAVVIRFKDEMWRLVEGGTGRVMLDLGQVDFVDSSGLGAIVAASKLVGADRRLELAALAPQVRKVFQLTRMDTVFAIHESADDAFTDLPYAS